MHKPSSIIETNRECYFITTKRFTSSRLSVAKMFSHLSPCERLHYSSFEITLNKCPHAG